MIETMAQGIITVLYRITHLIPGMAIHNTMIIMYTEVKSVFILYNAIVLLLSVILVSTSDPIPRVSSQQLLQTARTVSGSVQHI